MVQWFRTFAALVGPRFSFQYPCGSLSLSVTPVAEDSMPSSGLCGHLHAHGTHTYTQVLIHMHKIIEIHLKCPQTLNYQGPTSICVELIGPWKNSTSYISNLPKWPQPASRYLHHSSNAAEERNKAALPCWAQHSDAPHRWPELGTVQENLWDAQGTQLLWLARQKNVSPLKALFLKYKLTK